VVARGIAGQVLPRARRADDAWDVADFKGRSFGELSSWQARAAFNNGRLSGEALLSSVLGPGRLLVGGKGEHARRGVSWKQADGRVVRLGELLHHGVYANGPWVSFKPSGKTPVTAADRWAAGESKRRPTRSEVVVDRDFWTLGRVRRGKRTLPTNEGHVSYSPVQPAQRLGLLFGPGKLLAPPPKKDGPVRWRTSDGREILLGTMRIDRAGKPHMRVSRAARRVRNRYLGQLVVSYLQGLEHATDNAYYGRGWENPYQRRVTDSGPTVELGCRRGREETKLKVRSRSTATYSEWKGHGLYVIDVLNNEHIGYVPRQLADVLSPTNLGKDFRGPHAKIVFRFDSDRLPRDPYYRLPRGVKARHTIKVHDDGDSGTQQRITHTYELVGPGLRTGGKM
jgi:hypothetical protein